MCCFIPFLLVEDRRNIYFYKKKKKYTEQYKVHLFRKITQKIIVLYNDIIQQYNTNNE